MAYLSGPGNWFPIAQSRWAEWSSTYGNCPDFRLTVNQLNRSQSVEGLRRGVSALTIGQRIPDDWNSAAGWQMWMELIGQMSKARDRCEGRMPSRAARVGTQEPRPTPPATVRQEPVYTTMPVLTYQDPGAPTRPDPSKKKKRTPLHPGGRGWTPRPPRTDVILRDDPPPGKKIDFHPEGSGPLAFGPAAEGNGNGEATPPKKAGIPAPVWLAISIAVPMIVRYIWESGR